MQAQADMCSHKMRIMNNNTAEEKQATIRLTLERLHLDATESLRLLTYTRHVEDRLNVSQVALDWYNQSAPDTSMVRVQAMPSTSGPTTNLLFSASMWTLDVFMVLTVPITMGSRALRRNLNTKVHMPPKKSDGSFRAIPSVLVFGSSWYS